jgi:hypothetical protein
VVARLRKQGTMKLSLEAFSVSLLNVISCFGIQLLESSTGLQPRLLEIGYKFIFYNHSTSVPDGGCTDRIVVYILICIKYAEQCISWNM